MEVDSRNNTAYEKELEKLVADEKVALSANDTTKLSEICRRIVQLSHDNKEYGRMRELITTLTKRRGQSKKAIIDMIQLAMTYLDEFKSSERLLLLETLVAACEGKLYLEVEFARCTKLICEIKEEEGKIEEACGIIQDVQVETYGSMDKREKIEYILYQISLMLKKKDYVRTQLISKKINRKHLNEEGLQDLKIRFYKLMVQYYAHERMYMDAAKSYQTIYDTLKDKEMFDSREEKEYKEISFKNFVAYLLISPYSNEQVDLLNIVNTNYIRELENNSNILTFVKSFLLNELMPLNAQEIQKQVQGLQPFTETEYAQENFDLFTKYMIQHNLRVIQKYYIKAHLKRLSELLGVDAGRVETEIADMVVKKTLQAKINRMQQIVYFSGKKDESETLNEWNYDLKSLLDKIEDTCHLINRENIIYQ